MKNTNWYKDAIIYQIYPKSFKDSDDDGIGDLKGIITKLDYLVDLNVNCILLCNVLDSNEYQGVELVKDYYKINRKLGRKEELKELIDVAHQKGIKVMLSFPIAFVSFDNKWFKDAISNVDSEYKDYFIFTDSINNWEKIKGGSAWSKDNITNKYYLHTMCDNSADLNFANRAVIDEFIKIFNYYVALGVDGFKISGIDLLTKGDIKKNGFFLSNRKGKEKYSNQNGCHEVLKTFYDEVFSKHDTVVLGECLCSGLGESRSFFGKDKHELTSLYNYDHLMVDRRHNDRFLIRKFRLFSYKKTIGKLMGLSNEGIKVSLLNENEKLRRIIGRFKTSDSLFYFEVAKLFAASTHLLKGIPIIYQGEEIGMGNLKINNLENIVDGEAKAKLVTLHNYFFYKKKALEIVKNNAMDNAISIMQWDDSSYAGFSNVKPWVGMSSNKEYINAEYESSNSNSILSFYRKVIQIRKNYKDIIVDGAYKQIMPYRKNVFAYQRGKGNEVILVLSNFSDQKVRIDYSEIYEEHKYRIILNNYDTFKTKELRPYQCVAIYLTK